MEITWSQSVFVNKNIGIIVLSSNFIRLLFYQVIYLRISTIIFFIREQWKIDTYKNVGCFSLYQIEVMSIE